MLVRCFKIPFESSKNYSWKGSTQITGFLGPPKIQPPCQMEPKCFLKASRFGTMTASWGLQDVVFCCFVVVFLLNQNQLSPKRKSTVQEFEYTLIFPWNKSWPAQTSSLNPALYLFLTNKYTSNWSPTPCYAFRCQTIWELLCCKQEKEKQLLASSSDCF